MKRLPIILAALLCGGAYAQTDDGDADVQQVLLKNKQERHLRGGEATRIKYSEKHTGNI